MTHLFDYDPVTIQIILSNQPHSISSYTQFSFMDEKHLHHPLLPSASRADTNATNSVVTAFVSPTLSDSDKIISSNFGISIRLYVLLLIGFISVWANQEASKGFVITVVNNMEDTPAGEKFTLFYVSNDEAIRLVQSSFSFAAKVLYPGSKSTPEKLIDEVDIQLISHSLTNDQTVSVKSFRENNKYDVQLLSHNLTNDHTVAVKSFGEKSKYVLSLNPLVIESGDFRYRVRKEIQRGMAEILLFHQQHRAPKALLDGMVEYISDLADLGSPKLLSLRKIRKTANDVKLRKVIEKCWEAKDPRVVAKFLAYCEEKREGFVGRLNQEMNRDDWHERSMDKLLEMSAMHFCEEFHGSLLSGDMIY